jgi:Bacterial Ig-like domain
MASFLRIGDGRRRPRHNSGERTNRPLVWERLEYRVVLATGLTAGTATAVSATAGTLVTGAPLVTFTDGASPLPANDYSATIDWGDGTPLSGGTISVSGTTFTVDGSHNFAQPGEVYTVTVEIVGDGQQISTTTTATVDGLTYEEFALNPILPIIVNGEVAPPAFTAGTPSGALSFASFQASPTPDPTAYSAIVDWGDGSTPTDATFQTNSSGALVVDTSGHTYASAGEYSVMITIRGSQGFVVGSGGEQVDVYNPIATPVSELAEAGSASGPLIVALIWVEPGTEGALAPAEPIQPDYNFDPSYYSAAVDWGDGSPPVEATFTTFTPYQLSVTTSGHTYTQGGTYTITVTIRDAEGVVVDTVNPTISVGDSLSGHLGPPSDLSVSQQNDITNAPTPTFLGNTSPGATVEVFAVLAGSTSAAGSLVATTTAGGSGAWSATAADPMADGTYTVTGDVMNSLGAVVATAPLGTMVIDTVGPAVTSVTFDRRTAMAVITYQDNLSGLDLASVSNPAFYHLSAKPVSNRAREPRLVLPKSISVTPGASPTSPETVSVVFPHKGKGLRAGLYMLEIDSGNSGNGVEDIAGNALDGDFSGKFPSGDNNSGGDFIALISTAHGKVQAVTSAREGHPGIRPRRPSPRAH